MKLLLVKNKLLPFLLVLIGSLLGYYILYSGNERPNKFNKNKQKVIRTVQASKLVQTSVIPSWSASGFVIPAESVDVYSRVAGNVMSINPDAFPGGVLKEGEWLVKIDTTDFELALKSEEAKLEQAKANLSLVQVDQVLAKEELLLLNNNGALNIDEALVLREPQLTVAQANISVAENNVEKAQINLQRSQITMPFDGKIISKEVGTGSRVSTNTSLFSVINTEVYWLEVKIPHKFFSLLDKEALARVSQPRLWGEGKERQAHFISILPELDSLDRQVKVLLAIKQPQSETRDQPQVFINDFLNVQLQGEPIDNAWTIQHSWLQPDNTIWVIDKDSRLQKRAVTILFKERDLIYVHTKVESGDMALAEKPGIASVGLVVNIRENLLSTTETSVARINKEINEDKSTNPIENVKAEKTERVAYE
jgi:RND family efflux transporter MFP subunit